MKERIVYSNGQFTDFAGQIRKFVIAAVSTIIDTEIVTTEGDYVHTPKKKLSLGIAICNPTDTYNEEIGKKIAYSKAVSPSNTLCMFVCDGGMVNTKMVEALIEQEKEYFIAYPEKHIKGYLAAKTKYEANVKKESDKKNLVESLTSAELEVIHYFKDLPSNKRNTIMKLINEV